MSGFVQIIEFTSSRIDEIRALDPPNGEASTLRRATFTADRDRPNHYLSIIEFDSYESAMENSNRPETAAFAAQMEKLCDGPPKFYNLDVMEVWDR
ncbi:MAG: hypothetical protein J2P17_35985 [Mycobacterium sp.]|nr:hypothetical protein [Mycobacterium sp.]